MHAQTWINLAHLRTWFLWALVLPAAFAEETTTESAGVSQVSRPGPDLGIVGNGIVPGQDAPPVAGINIHHHGHIHDPLQAETEHNQSLVQRSSSASTLPTAFDTSLSNNFTSDSCPKFFTKFLSDSSFTNCHAVSTLLRDSTGFFHTLTSAVSTSLVLDTACAADVDSCVSTISNFASDLLDDSNCGQDYDDGNPLVTNAYLDMITYEPIYRATCLQDPDTSDYCFVDAVTNSSNPSNYDVYFLPYGSTIDSSSLPTCNSCLQATLGIFSQWAQVKDQPLADSYLSSASAVNTRCGSDFARVNITVGKESSVPSASSTLRRLSLPLWVSVTVGSIILVLCI
ncbi:hypothetical protein BJX76DRAFT_338831 [Aspergillus varians]